MTRKCWLTVYFSLLGCFNLLSVALHAQQAPLNSVETILYDMKGLHEGRPHGVPLSYNWSQAPRVGMGNNPGGFRAFTAWGQVYEDAKGSSATNTRVQLKNIKTYVLSKKDGTWRLVQESADVQGAAYREDFIDDINKPANVRAEDEGISVKLEPGYNFHYWPPTGRADIDPEDIAGVFTTMQARLITDDETKPDDRAEARYLLSMGADYWLNATAQWDQWKTNGDVAIAKFKYVTAAWQAFNMISVAEDVLRENPPPLE
jgi:hypothetical protein